MRRFTTITQRRILKYFWHRQTVFTLDDLIAEKIIHSPTLGRLTLRVMEARGQILPRDSESGEAQYFATTDSKEEWKKIWAPTSFVEKYFSDPAFIMRGTNRYERAKAVAEMEKMLEDFRKGIEAADKGQPSRVKHYS